MMETTPFHLSSTSSSTYSPSTSSSTTTSFSSSSSSSSSLSTTRTPQHDCNQAIIFFQSRNYDAAFPLFESAAKSHKHAVARYYLGLCHLHGYGTSVNEIKAFVCFEVAAKHGHVKARCELGDCYLLGRGTSCSAKTAFDHYKSASAVGDGLSEFKVAQCYLQGIGVNKDVNEGLKYLKYSCIHNYAPAQYQQGKWYDEDCIQHGQSVNKEEAKRFFKLAADNGHVLGRYEYARACCDNKSRESQLEALKFFKLAAEQGHHKAQGYTGWYLYQGKCVQQDFSQALKYYQMAADQGNSIAFSNIGWCYEHGEGVEIDTPKAFEYYKLSADDGCCFGLYNVGKCYKYGIGIQEDHTQVVRYLSNSAEKGYARAFCELGDCHLKGIGVEKRDNNEAFKNFLVAAQKEDKEAQNEVGNCYRFGRGVTIDLEEAENYYHLAADQDYQPAINNLIDLQERKENITKRLRTELPSKFFCPITHEIMTDPVVCVDGNSYERKAIEDWFRRSNHSPLTNLPLPSKQLIPNFTLKQSINEMVEKILR